LFYWAHNRRESGLYDAVRMIRRPPLIFLAAALAGSSSQGWAQVVESNLSIPAEPLAIVVSAPASETLGIEPTADAGVSLPQASLLTEGSDRGAIDRVAAAAQGAAQSPSGAASASEPGESGRELFDGERRAVVVIPGDGIGPEITLAARRIIDASGAKIDWQEHLAGAAALAAHGTPLPQSTIDAIRKTGVALKAPLATPTGGGYRSINLTLRQEFDLYANFRPAKNLPGVPATRSDVDVIIMRENLEDLYVGEEREVAPGVVESIRRISYRGSERIARAAFETARRLGRKKVTAVHKANIIKLGDGLFLQAARDVSRDYPDIAYEEMIVDATAERLASRPTTLDVLVMPNVWGDILSDLAAGLVGRLGVVPSATFGDHTAIFEAVHGTAPDIAGKGVANPTALLRSAVLMLRHIGQSGPADRIETALMTVLADPVARTGDLGGKGTTASFADAVINELNRLSPPRQP
jgi:isocitrate dehydrogenase (NAD+)